MVFLEYCHKLGIELGIELRVCSLLFLPNLVQDFIAQIAPHYLFALVVFLGKDAKHIFTCLTYIGMRRVMVNEDKRVLCKGWSYGQAKLLRWG